MASRPERCDFSGVDSGVWSARCSPAQFFSRVPPQLPRSMRNRANPPSSTLSLLAAMAGRVVERLDRNSALITRQEAQRLRCIQAAPFCRCQGSSRCESHIARRNSHRRDASRRWEIQGSSRCPRFRSLGSQLSSESWPPQLLQTSIVVVDAHCPMFAPCGQRSLPCMALEEVKLNRRQLRR